MSYVFLYITLTILDLIFLATFLIQKFSSPFSLQNLIVSSRSWNREQGVSHNLWGYTSFSWQASTILDIFSVKCTRQIYQDWVRPIAGDIEWTIKGKTRVEELEETHSGLRFSTYKFVPFVSLNLFL